MVLQVPGVFVAGQPTPFSLRGWGRYLFAGHHLAEFASRPAAMAETMDKRLALAQEVPETGLRCRCETDTRSHPHGCGLARLSAADRLSRVCVCPVLPGRCPRPARVY